MPSNDKSSIASIRMPENNSGSGRDIDSTSSH